MSSMWAVGPCVPDKGHLVRVGSPLPEKRAGPVQTRPIASPSADEPATALPRQE